MSATVPRYAIHFYNYKWIQNEQKKSVILLDDIAKRLKVSSQDILNAFKLWGEAGYPQEYFLATDTGQKAKGGTYDTGILIWNYQGGNKGNSTPTPNMMGVISKVREWGNGYKTIDGTRRESFYLGPLA